MRVANQRQLDGQLKSCIVLKLKDGRQPGLKNVKEHVGILGLVVNIFATEDYNLDGVEHHTNGLLGEKVVILVKDI